jgi:hypothetical protein
MKTLRIEPTDDSPTIILDKANGKFEISGRSLPEDSAEFYGPVMQWMADYSKEPNTVTEFVFKLDYSNTASTKFIHEILRILEKVKGAKIIWWHLEDDEDMEATGVEFSEQIEIPFEFKIY